MRTSFQRTDPVSHAERVNVCMYAPSAAGGMARYAHEALSGIAATGGSPEVQASLVTSVDLDPRYRDVPYPIHAILPPLVHRSAYDDNVRWALGRVRHYHRRERTFLTWVDAHPSATQGIHFQEYTPWLAPAHFRRLRARGRRLYVTVHNLYPHRYLPSAARPVYRTWIRQAWRHCDGLFVHADDLRANLAQFLGAGHPPIFVTPHGVWSSSGAVGGADPAERVRDRRLLFFGVIRRNKGLPVLLRAMERLEDCTLTIAGEYDDPGYRDEIKPLVDRLPVGQVELIDRFVPDEEVAEIFSRSTLSVLPYTSFAAQSGVLHDALAHTLPVVVTDVGTLGESVRAWDVGEVVAADDPAALAGAIRAMLVPDRYAEGVAAVVRARETLSWDRTAELTVEAYRSTGLGRSRTDGA